MHEHTTRTRDVWRELSRTPRVTIRELATRTGHGTTQITRALNDLERLGYISRDRGLVGARTIHVFYAEAK